MQVWLQVSAGQSIGQKFHLRGGQLARFGKSDWADFSFPDDPAMDQIQFEVRVDPHGPQLRHSGKQAETFVNGQAVKDHALQNGDVVAAGETTFSVYIEGEITAAPGTATAEATQQAALQPWEIACDMQVMGKYLELDAEPLGLASTKQSPRELVAALRQQGEYPAALRVQAHYLSKQVAVQWGVACLRQVAGDKLLPEHEKTLQAAERWGNGPTEELRLAAGRLAEAAYYEGPAAMLALAVFCSGGNIGHPDHAAVLPDDRITGKCVATSLVQAAYLNDPTRSQQRYEAFLDHELTGSKGAA